MTLMSAQSAKRAGTGGARRRKTSAPAAARRDPVAEFLALPDAEKERIWESYNREIPFAETRPLNAEQRRTWARAKRKRGRPRQGLGAEAVSVTIERGLLQEADAYADRIGLSRSQLIAQALRSEIRAAGKK